MKSSDRRAAAPRPLPPPPNHLPALLVGPQLPPDVGRGRGRVPRVLPQRRAHGRRHRGRLAQAACHAVAGGRVHQIGGGAKGRHRLVAARERAAHRDVRPLLLMHLTQLQGQVGWVGRNWVGWVEIGLGGC
jgi:hypothetical protein